MRFSIVIPSYNQQEYLPDAIESALSQTVPCEVIVVVDGSPDHSKEVAEKYPVKVINQVNKGLASARNAGVMAMTGDIFMPLDSDDVLMENCIEEIQKVFETTDADIVAPSCKCFGVGNDEIILIPEPKLEDFRVGNRIGYFSAIKKNALIECGGYNPKMFAYEDYALWIDLLTRGKKIKTIPTPLVLYRTKTISMWKDAVKNHHVELMNKIYKDYPNFLPA